MKFCISLAIALATTFAVAGCDRDQRTAESAEPATPATSARATEATEATEVGSEPKTEPESVAETANMSAHEVLDSMDGRTPVPLQPMMAWHQKQNMMDHLVAIQEINSGVAAEDWPKVEAAAARIGSSPQMKTMCEHMGKGADGFTELALEFHSRADTIGKAAEARDRLAVIKATGHTLEACTSCHAAYKQQVVSADEWTRLTR